MNSESWEIDPATGDYLQKDGSPVVTTSLKMPAYFRLKVQRTRWLHAPDVNYGSDFWTRRTRLTNNEPTIAKTIGTRALAPILLDGRAQSIDTVVESVKRNRIQLVSKLKDSTGHVETVTLNPIGR